MTAFFAKLCVEGENEYRFFRNNPRRSLVPR